MIVGNMIVGVYKTPNMDVYLSVEKIEPIISATCKEKKLCDHRF